MRKSVKQQNQKIVKIDFKPTTIEEEKHLEKMKSLLTQKRRGDWDLGAEILSIPQQSFIKAFLRVTAKNHFEAVSALEKVIENRKNLLNQ